MVLRQKWPFIQLLFLGNIGNENVFYYILEQKNAFPSKKKKTSKTPKIDTFPKGLTYGCGSKMAIFPTFLFRQYRPGKCLLRYSKTKKPLSRLQKQKVQKVEKLTFFPKGLTHGFGPKMAIFPTFLYRQYRPEKCLLRYSRTKKTPV